MSLVILMILYVVTYFVGYSWWQQNK